MNTISGDLHHSPLLEEEWKEEEEEKEDPLSALREVSVSPPDDSAERQPTLMFESKSLQGHEVPKEEKLLSRDKFTEEDADLMDFKDLLDLYNLALHKPTKVVSNGKVSAHPRHFPQKVNDGLTRGHAGSYASVPLRGPNMYWEVDLQDDSTVNELVIMLHPMSARGDPVTNTSDRNCSVSLLSANLTVIQTIHLWTTVGSIRWKQTQAVNHVRYVRIQAEGTGGLPLEEVEVLGPLPPGNSQSEMIKEQVTLFVSYFQSKNPARREEIDYVLKRNLQNPHIKEVRVFIDWCNKTQVPFKHPKLVQVCWHGQPTYRDYFEQANEHAKGGLAIISNGDIVFTDTIRHFPVSIPVDSRKGHVLARWPTNCPTFVKPSRQENPCWVNFASYDTFVFRPPVPESVTHNLTFVMNRMFAEHVTANALKTHLNLSNPCLDVVTMHYHCSNLREWKKGKTYWAVPVEQLSKPEKYQSKALDSTESLK